MNALKMPSLLERHLPSSSVPYCLNLWKKYPFEFHVSKKRLTKAGDFSCRQSQPSVITVNGDLHPYLFLTTFIHEFSHHAVHLVYGNLRNPHGQEWKLAFRTFMKPVLVPEIFPQDILLCLAAHLRNPPASTFSDPMLTAIFRKYGRDREILVSDLEEGKVFRVRKKWFTKGKLKRTRIVCRESLTRKIYLVPADLPVSEVRSP